MPSHAEAVRCPIEVRDPPDAGEYRVEVSMQQGKGGDVYRLVFELTARATDVPYDAFLVELVQGLAAHYQARICRLHIGEQAAATSDENSLLSGLDPDDCSRFLTLDSLLAAEVREDGVLRIWLPVGQ